MPTLLCPSCGTTLTVSQAAPARLTCPRCLGRVENPDFSAGPLPVMPLEHEVRIDQMAGNGGVIAVVVLLGLGVFALFWAGEKTAALVGTLVLVALCVVASIISTARQARSAVLDPTSAAADAGRILNYRSPPGPQGTVGSIPPALLFTLGLIGGPIATVVLSMLAAPLALLVLPTAIVLACTPRLRPLGAGVLAGFGIALLIVLTLCGGILLMSR